MNSQTTNNWGGKRPRSGRPAQHAHGTTTTAISLPTDLLEWIDATRGATPRSTFIARALAEVRQKSNGP
jgi:hypothetical protein